MVTAAGPSVVISDAIPLVVAGLTSVLGNAGYRVVGATANSVELPELVAARTPGIVVLGSTSDLTQIETVRRLRAAAPPTCIVLLLPNGSRESLAELLGLDVEALLARFIEPAELVSSLKRAWSGERVVDPKLLNSEVDVEAEASSLTTREYQVLAKLATGQSNRQIASELFVSLPTVKTHLAHIYAKLGAKNRNEALARAMTLGFLT
ncbi:MAG: response regulator transcription factor [Acidimicrobiia bacterium]|nr:response regulator transcription factor [Acidimicrobiia bacterium]